MSFLKRYPSVLQQDSSDCGPAALSTVMKYYGSYMRISKIREVAGTDRFGTSVLGLIKAAEFLGFDSKAIRMSTKNNIFKEFTKPAIVHVKNKDNFPHYLVVYDVKDKYITVSDPAEGIVKYSIDEFYKIWDGIIIFLVPNDEFKIYKKDKGVWRNYIKLIQGEKRFFLIIFIMSVLVNLLGLAGTAYYKFIIDDIAVNNTLDKATVVSLGMIFLIILKCGVEYSRSIMVVKVSQRIDRLIVLNFYNHVITLPMNFYRTRRIGDIVSRFNDAGKIRDALSNVTISIMLDLLMVIIGTGVLYAYNKTLFLLSLMPVTVYLLLMFIFKNPMKKTNRKLMEKSSNLYSYLFESLSGIELVKSVNGERLAISKTNKKFDDLLESNLKYSNVQNLHEGLKTGIDSLFTVIVLWVGVIQVLKGSFSIGSLISYNALLAYFIGPVERIIGLQAQIQSAFVAADRLNEIMDMPMEGKNDKKDASKDESLFGDIEFKNVDFRYGTREKVLKDISMKLDKGAKIAFVGESGSGKTTLAKLLMRFYEIENGDILINSHKIQDIDKGFLRDKIAYVSQDYFFFCASIRENLLFVNPRLREDDMIRICKMVQMDEFIQTLPDKYDTILEENAANLSSGQRQRLTIAKALVRNPEILILDEVTSNLDSITELAIEKALDGYSDNITRIFIAHRLSTIMSCDKIFVFKKGDLIEEGTHEELMSNEGYYYELCCNQGITQKKVLSM